jgi:DNA-binding transcriptional regulator YiaG
MSTEETAGDQIAKRIREAVSALQTDKARVIVPLDMHHETLQDGLRTLARSRVNNSLRQLRAASGLSYADVAAQTGLTQQMLFDVEYKERRLTLAELRLLATCYDVGINDLLGVDVD